MTDVCPPKEEAVSSSSLLVLPKQRCSESQLTNENPKQFKEVSPDTVAIERGHWLTDTHISSVNEILKHQFPSISGLQNPLYYGQNLTFERMSEPYVQIIHTDGDHWLAVQGVH